MGETEKIKKGDDRVEITITTKHGDFAEVEFDVLRDDIEVTPEDMRLARRAFKNSYREYVKKRGKEVDVGRAEAVREEKEKVDVLSPYHLYVKESMASGSNIELSLLSHEGNVVGWNPYTRRNGPVEDFHPSRFRVDGVVVDISKEMKVKEKVAMAISPPADELPSDVKEEEEVDVSVGDGQEENQARSSATIIQDDGITKKESDYDG